MKIGREEPDTYLNDVLETIGINECCSLAFTVSVIFFDLLLLIGYTDWLCLLGPAGWVPPGDGDGVQSWKLRVLCGGRDNR
jgi:hypothetical protein